MTTLTTTSADSHRDSVSTATAPRARTALTWGYRALLAASVALAAFATFVPWAMQRSGDHLVTITSGSMVPHFPVGSVITIHDAAEPAALEPGQIITFRALGNGTVITHRIAKVVNNPGQSGVFYQTKGDANRTNDPDLAPAANVIGVADGVVPPWQQFAVWLQTPKGRLLAYGTLFLVVALGELASLLGGLRTRKEAS